MLSADATNFHAVDPKGIQQIRNWLPSPNKVHFFLSSTSRKVKTEPFKRGLLDTDSPFCHSSNRQHTRLILGATLLLSLCASNIGRVGNTNPGSLNILVETVLSMLYLSITRNSPLQFFLFFILFFLRKSMRFVH